MKAAVVVFPGSNCDHDVAFVLRHSLAIETRFVWHRDTLPKGFDLVVLPGGFSFGDYLRCGAIARTSDVLASVASHANAGGLVLGICNGFQILTESGLLPGALTRNLGLRFVCKDVLIRAQGVGPCDSFTSPFALPIAHAEGRYHADPETLRRLNGEGLVAFRYCNAEGTTELESNPNGSLDNIAGIRGGPRRNILGLMPHPERRAEVALGGVDGKLLLEAFVRDAKL